jgi:hypothetical protein
MVDGFRDGFTDSRLPPIRGWATGGKKEREGGWPSLQVKQLHFQIGA